VGVLTMLYGLGHWNSFFYGFVFLQDKALFPLQVVLRNILIMNEVGIDSFQDLAYAMKMAGINDLLKFALIVVSSVPVLALYPFVQRYFVKGVMIGSIKG
jgi:putative aldouronate transport system permease protein